ncbi:unnamed protein product [Staurois parvus]|uniref:Uncharacterized protein n=1 Tax=Staurois parvus TaxID=386267 RepID=A0ABN9F6K3_9NEOB|nr:unnamed protein product [Staurois parvus]
MGELFHKSGQRWLILCAPTTKREDGGCAALMSSNVTEPFIPNFQITDVSWPWNPWGGFTKTGGCKIRCGCAWQPISFTNDGALFLQLTPMMGHYSFH